MRTTFSEFSRNIQPVWGPSGKGRLPMYADGSNFRRDTPCAFAQPEKSKFNDRFALERADDLCGFAAGALIACLDGAHRVEELKVGDFVQTLDHGPQPIRWIGMNPLEAVGDFAPVRFEMGAFGANKTLDVGPHQRMHLAMPTMELLFGFPEGLAAAKYLINGEAVSHKKGGEADFFQLLFDEHEIIWANGVATESLFLDELADDTSSNGQTSISALFPELADEITRQSQTARPVLEGFEARLAMNYSKSPSDMVLPDPFQNNGLFGSA